ncbi:MULTISPECIES: substrate-binding domain-containing protein [unclassified Corynebacterium]|uniref:substrate-binding domain-containing protein n=1 Tax=unclassified Corynebacterium TaxID=2624378 RepID=UPI00264B0AC0|nr:MULTISPECIES: substrate-binding domain-containing protein [unclassified Corynebacterium]MDN8595189.1 substrate-binding domain-containing protein [Corynebacterium sp. P4_F2]WKK55318.1 substrate-binding domain-containing protein [Corynebacterium sp. P4-C1]WKK62727.1 substrate-binding domain-containing protein [Corynebacterium sp. P8-C1]
MIKTRKALTASILAAVSVFAVGCSSTNSPSEDAIQATGSATVEPITSYMANRYDFDVNVEAIGSTDGFEKFCNGEADINDASVAIPGSGAPVDFQKQCADNKVEYIELPIGLDAITIVKHRDNDFAADLTIDQLHDIWSKDSPVTKWSDIDPSWPDEEIKLYGRPDGSGTLGVFKALVLQGDEIRDDYEATDDIQELSRWVSEDENALSFMGIGNYLATEDEYQKFIDNVNIDGIAPTAEETKKGNYPLSRPLFIYVNKKSTEREDVDKFVTTYLENSEAVMPRVFFYQLPEEDYDSAKKRYADRKTGPDDRWQS